MQLKKINPIIQWWMTPKLPYHDIYELPLLIDKTPLLVIKHIFSQWFIHPIRRRLARFYLKTLQRFTNIVVIGITGSAGKTTTKEMLYAILKRQGKTVCTSGFIDPVYNIPNTILKTAPGTKYLILEMGVEFPGEMDYYLWLATPIVGVITNIFPTHVEFFGDENGVLMEKSKLVKSIPANGASILNSGDNKLRALKGKLSSKIIWFDSDINPTKQNGNAAVAVARFLGIYEKYIRNGLGSYAPPAHRLVTIKLKSGAKILDDSYNSNLKAALATLYFFNTNFKGKKIAILGEMRELGKYTESSHRELGKEIAKSGFDYVFCVGESMKYLISEVNRYSPKTKTLILLDYDEITHLVKPLLGSNTCLLVKGARSLRLDKIVDKLS